MENSAATSARDEASVKQELERELSAYDFWTAGWMRDFLGDLPLREDVRKTGNGIIRDLVAIARNIRTANIDIDYSPELANLEFSALDKYPASIKTAVIRRACENDMYGYVGPAAKAYAKQHGLELSACTAA